MTEHFAKKQDLLAAELQQYFGRTCPALLARGQAASASLGPPSQDELNARFCELAEATRETNRQLRVDLSPVLEGASSEPFVDHALASIEHLREIAESIMRRLDELSAPPVELLRGVGTSHLARDPQPGFPIRLADAVH